MKNKSVISMLLAGACAFAVQQQAKANPFFTDTVTATLTGSTISSLSFVLTTTVTEATPGAEYDYTYSFDSGSTTLNSFTVEGVMAGTFDTTGLNTVTSVSPAYSETLADVLANGQATWGSPNRVGGAQRLFVLLAAASHSWHSVRGRRPTVSDQASRFSQLPRSRVSSGWWRDRCSLGQRDDGHGPYPPQAVIS